MSSCLSLPTIPPLQSATQHLEWRFNQLNTTIHKITKKVANTNTDKDNDYDKDTDKHKCKTLNDSKLLNPQKNKISPVCRMNRQRRTQIQVQKDELRFSIQMIPVT